MFVCQLCYYCMLEEVKPWFKVNATQLDFVVSTTTLEIFGPYYILYAIHLSNEIQQKPYITRYRIETKKLQESNRKDCHISIRHELTKKGQNVR